MKHDVEGHEKGLSMGWRWALSLAALIAVLGLFVELRTGITRGPNEDEISRFAAWFNFLKTPPSSVHEIAPAKFVINPLGAMVANPDEQNVNKDGFRTAGFDEAAPRERKRVLFLGDSFTWGLSADPLTDCFVDLLWKAGYDTINLGIPSTGPNQYLALAKEYLPRLKPDAVVVATSFENDTHKDFAIVPGAPPFYMTNVGWINARDRNGKLLTLPEAVRAHIDSALMIDVDNSTTAANTYKTLHTLHDLSVAAGASFFLFEIPSNTATSWETDYTAQVTAPVSDLAPSVAEGIGPEHYYPGSDGHFNNAGHALYARHIEKRLTAAGFAPVPRAPLLLLPPLTGQRYHADLGTLLSYWGLNENQKSAVLAFALAAKQSRCNLLDEGTGHRLRQFAAALAESEKGNDAAWEAAHALLDVNTWPQAEREQFQAALTAQLTALRATSAAQLEKPQQRMLAAVPLDAWAVMDDGGDPVRERVAAVLAAEFPEAAAQWCARLLPDASCDLASLARFMELDAAGESKLGQTLAAFRQDAAAVAAANGEDLLKSVKVAKEPLDPALAGDNGSGMDKGAYGTFRLKFIEAFGAGKLWHLSFLPTKVLLSCELGPYSPPPISKPGGNAMSFDALATELGLDTEKASAARAAFNNLKAETVLLISSPATNGGAPPIEFMSQIMRAEHPDYLGEFVAYIKEHNDSASGRKYLETLARLEQDCAAALTTALGGDTFKQLRARVGESLGNVSTGYDPWAWQLDWIAQREDAALKTGSTQTAAGPAAGT